MHERVRTSRPLTATVVGAVTVAAVGALGLLAAPSAYAGPPGTWTTLGSTGVVNITQPATGRFGGTLTVAWTVQQGAGESILTRTVSASGAVGATQAAVSGWSDLAYDPKVLADGADRQVVFGGIRTINGGETYKGDRIYHARAGGTWSLGPYTDFPVSTSAYAGYGYGAVELPGGRTLTGYSLNGTIYLSDDAAHTNTVNVPGNESTYNTNLVRDSASGAVWVVVFLGDSDATATSRTGVWAHELDVSTGIVPVGGWTRLPGSVTHNQFGWNALNPLQDLPVAAPTGGGAYVAYGMGYPTATQVRIQRLGSSAGITVKATGKDVRQVSLTSSGSKLWVSWAKPGSIWAARTNNAKSRIGAIRHIGTPGKDATVYHLTSQGGAGRLDLVVTAQAFPKPLAVSHTQVLAGLSVSLSKAKIKSSRGGKQRVTVADAGAAVSGAKVTLDGKTKRTKSNGTAKFAIAKGTAKGKYKVVAKAGGYAAGKAKFKVT